MTIQWTAIAFILYAEIGVVLLLLLPWIRPSIWKKLFNSRLVSSISQFSKYYSYSVIAVLLLLFFDATREVRKYMDVDLSETRSRIADADAVIHMRLFRAQRNLYISGFALLLAMVINRIVSLLARSAQLEAAAEAAIRQAENASKTAKTLMEADDNSDGGKKVATEKKELLSKLKSAEADRDAMKAQAENLQEEYDRVCSELNDHERRSRKQSGGKKTD